LAYKIEKKQRADLKIGHYTRENPKRAGQAQASPAPTKLEAKPGAELLRFCIVRASKIRERKVCGLLS
jgi:hypothetical protein